MIGFANYNQPAGTWSDDTSMNLCLLDSLKEGLDYEDIMKKFSNWMMYGDYTAHGEVFDMGNSTKQAIFKFTRGIESIRCGGESATIKSSSYVLDTLEPALWCLLNTNNYRDCVLKAVNLGNDTDTVAAVAGGLAGIAYGINDIPKNG